MKTMWENKQPDRKTQQLMKDDSCYAILLYDIVDKRKKMSVTVLHLDRKRKQIVLRANTGNDDFAMLVGLDIFRFSYHNPSNSEPVTSSFLGSHVGFMLFGMLFLARNFATDVWTPNYVFKYKGIKKIVVEDKQKLIRRHLDTTGVED